MRIILILILAFTAATSASAQPCEATEGRSSILLSREVAGERAFRKYLEGPGWIFALENAEYGWDIRLFDENGLDLTQMTPPLRSAPNPREIYGWHFRNTDNTGMNKGDVNAPQGLRLFGFDPALTGTGGFKPAPGANGFDPQNQPGQGVLKIEDFGLADLEPGQNARMVYMNFNICMTWPTTDREKQQAAAEQATLEASREVTPVMQELMGSCGLALDQYDITAFLTPVELDGDFDGQDTIDMAVPITRKSDGKRGISICRAGTWNHVLGMDDKPIGEYLTSGYFDSIDWWSLHPKGEIGASIGERGPPPTMIGDGITIGKEGASSVLILWDGEKFTSYWQGD